MKSLADRMRLFVQGQVTWPDPDRHGNARCASCRHVAVHLDSSDHPTDRARCALVKALTGKRGLLFYHETARACTKYERR